MIALVPIGGDQLPAGFEHAQQFIGKSLLISDVGRALHGPHHIHAGIREIELEGIHHGEAARQIGGRELRGPLHLPRADADAEHVKAVAAGQAPAAAANAAAHIEHLGASGQAFQAAPLG